MNTSSRPESDLLPFVGARAERRDRLFQRRGVVAADVQHGAERHRLLHAGLLAELLGELEQIRAADRPGRQMRLRDHLGDRAVREQLAVEDVGEPVAALGLVHVVRGDEERQPLAGELVDLLPEIAARLGSTPAVGSSSSSSFGS